MDTVGDYKTLRERIVEYKIEHNIPIPVSRSKYPFDEMEVGDSFFVKCEKKDKAKKQGILFSCANQNAKRRKSERTFSTRQVDGGIRVWRIK